MLRGTLIAAISLAALASSSTAQADDVCMSLPVAFHASRVAQSLDVGPFFSSDGASLVSDGWVADGWVADGWVSRGRHPALEHQEGAPLAELRWCWSASDPSCSPKTPAPEDALRGLRSAHGALATGETDRWPILDDGDRPPRYGRLGGPREGVSARVERPPRLRAVDRATRARGQHALEAAAP